ncbi:sugar-binding domain-containing protein [Polaribacter atrinae]|uniref:sugar-binding domain-containing protein n=1 Tax=Polaribacter atrinae TaxID=1333662 RepID=UPI0030FB301D
MKHFLYLTVIIFIASCSKKDNFRIVEDFNQNWKFSLANQSNSEAFNFDDTNWRTLNVPHDWSIEKGYQKEGETASSTGFVVGGIGWYRKSFTLKAEDKEKYISVQFDGVYNNSEVWINGHFLGKRPNGYSSFSYNLSDYLKFDGSKNVIAVKVYRKAYADSRWYTGSGIYRKVQLIKQSKLHIAQWGVQITTPEVSEEKAVVHINTKLENASTKVFSNLSLNYKIIDNNGNEITKNDKEISNIDEIANIEIDIKNPKLWSTKTANLYKLEVKLLQNGKIIDNSTETFGIRIIDFDANKGFFLNGKNVKIKGVNLHHEAGAVGAAVPKAIWEYRIKKLKSIGVNAIRFAHNPHAIELLEVCDAEGMLVMNEAFDEWNVPKKKSKIHIGDNNASEESAIAYPAVFDEWAERDLKDLIRRDFNHPSVFMWSIGNEIEWTFPHYPKTFAEVNAKSSDQGYELVPTYDEEVIKKVFHKNMVGKDPLATIAKKLTKWVKEVDTTRPVTCGSVLPSVGMASGYGKTVDVFGFNYRATEYDVAHKTYPNLVILGSENWGNYDEWKSVKERDFVSGIFVWTGFAYLGEAGPWPRKGLNISFFDYAGFKTPRGHFYETLWKDDPKVYMVTTPASESEFSFSEKNGWKFDMQFTPPPVWKMLRKWEWYKVYPKWKYENNEAIVVQAYTNCEEAELFLNNKSLGKQKLADFKETDNIIKWLVPYNKGELKVIGYNNGIKADEYILNTTSKIVSKIKIKSTKKQLKADGYDVAIIKINLLDENGNLITDNEQEITFNLSGPGKNIGVDNGWEMNVQPHKTNVTKTHQGKAILIVQSTNEKGSILVSASVKDIKSNDLAILSK